MHRLEHSPNRDLCGRLHVPVGLRRIESKQQSREVQLLSYGGRSSRTWYGSRGCHGGLANLQRSQSRLSNCEPCWRRFRSATPPAANRRAASAMPAIRRSAARSRLAEIPAIARASEETFYEGHFDDPKSRRSMRSVPLGLACLCITGSKVRYVRRAGFRQSSGNASRSTGVARTSAQAGGRRRQ
jgi:hypothetical protein